MIEITADEIQMLLDALGESSFYEPDYDKVDRAKDFLFERLEKSKQ